MKAPKQQITAKYQKKKSTGLKSLDIFWAKQEKEKICELTPKVTKTTSPKCDNLIVKNKIFILVFVWIKFVLFPTLV